MRDIAMNVERLLLSLEIVLGVTIAKKLDVPPARKNTIRKNAEFYKNQKKRNNKSIFL
jgi:hypothetical protein